MTSAGPRPQRVEGRGRQCRRSDPQVRPAARCCRGREPANYTLTSATDAHFTFAGSDGGWARAFGAVTVPDNADKLVILLKAENQLGDADVCWFDGVGLYRMEAVR